MSSEPTIIIGAGLAGLSAAVALSAKGERVILLEKEAEVGGKMRRQPVGNHHVDAGPTVFTMKWVFERLFAMGNADFETQVPLKKADTLARHAWDDSDVFDLFADQKQSEDEVTRFFGRKNAEGYRRFCKDSAAIFDTLKDTYIAAPCPSPTQLAARVGFTKVSKLMALKPLQTLWRSLGSYFPDQRLQQLFGRYATYVGSSPFMAPATLMLIAHVEQDGVWLVKGGMHGLARAMAKLAAAQGADIRLGADIAEILTEGRQSVGVRLADGEELRSGRILYCGDVSRLVRPFLASPAMADAAVAPSKRSLSAVTWSVSAQTSGFPLKRHNVFFSSDYAREFEALTKHRRIPEDPTVYVCAQDQEEDVPLASGAAERMLFLINAPAFGDRKRLNEEEISQCLELTQSRLAQCGLTVDLATAQIEATQPADFETLFPSSGGALYGRASHGWTASFARPGTKSPIKGLYLAGGSVHPGAGVPMATLSGMLAAEQILKDHALT
ncbi:MAG: 1-hydroxycarotenoid 3,4-desaturase CrtD [Sphingomonadales bacterium]